MTKSESAEVAVSFSLLVTLSLFPLWLWIRMGARGIPVFPLVAVLYLVYYAWPVVSLDPASLGVGFEAIARAGFDVSIYLCFACTGWLLATRGQPVPRPESKRLDAVANRRSNEIAMVGIGMGLVFQVGIGAGALDWLGSAFGAVRAVAFSFVNLSAFLLGSARGSKKLARGQWALVLVMLGALIAISWASLYLVQGLFILGILALGYLTTAKRIPILPLLAVLPVAYILHAGKEEMRKKHWDAGQMARISVASLPGHFTEWMSDGVTVVKEGRQRQDLLSRASLIQMIILAHSRTPGELDHLHGATYALLPSLLVPRFLQADKPDSQAPMNMLNLRYGLVQADVSGRVETAIGWGFIAEAFVNFGIWGIVGIGLLTGLMMGAFSRWSENAPAWSMPSLAAIAALAAFANLETDFAYMCTVLFQTLVAVALLRVVLIMVGKATPPHPTLTTGSSASP